MRIQCYIMSVLWRLCFSSFSTLPSDEEVIVSITAVDSMDLFYVQLEENYSRLVSVDERMQNCISLNE